MSADLSRIVARFDADSDRMADTLRSLLWTECERTQRWTSPDGRLSLRLAAAWERARMDAVSAWRAG